MGWSFAIASVCDTERVTWLSQPFSYELERDCGCLGGFITPEEAAALSPDDVYNPDDWRPRDAGRIARILSRLRDRLREENDRLPVDHVLWFVDENGKRWNGSTQITPPFGGIKLRQALREVVKLDGGHGDIAHRSDLKRYRVRVDPVKLEQLTVRAQRWIVECGLGARQGVTLPRTFAAADADPLVEEFDCWVPVAPVLDVLGARVEVQSFDALARFGRDLDAAIKVCHRCRTEGLPLFWLAG